MRDTRPPTAAEAAHLDWLARELNAVPCRFCEGTGRVAVDRCAEIVHGRRCKNLARNDPAYFEHYPERSWAKPYCGMHGNMRLRDWIATEDADAAPRQCAATTTEERGEGEE